LFEYDDELKENVAFKKKFQTMLTQICMDNKNKKKKILTRK